MSSVDETQGVTLSCVASLPFGAIVLLHGENLNQASCDLVKGSYLACLLILFLSDLFLIILKLVADYSEMLTGIYGNVWHQKKL